MVSSRWKITAAPNPANPENIVTTRGAGNCTVDKLGETDYKGLRGQLRWNPSNAVDVTLAGDYTYQNQTNAPKSRPVRPIPIISAENTALTQIFTRPALISSIPMNSRARHIAERGAQTGAQSADTSITAYRAYTATFGTDDDFSPGVEPTLGDPSVRSNRAASIS